MSDRPFFSIIVTMDTRPGSDGETSQVGDSGEGSLHGVRSFDFLTDLPQTIANFFSGYQFDLFLSIDEHMPIPKEVYTRMYELKRAGILHRWESMPRDRLSYKWNDKRYNQALQQYHPEATHIVKIDQDCAMFRDPNSEIIAKYLEWLETYSYVCQPAASPEDKSWHASTRFFVTRVGTPKFDELESCMDQQWIFENYGNYWCPCYEFYLGVTCGGNVLYPPPDEESYTIWSWARYAKNTLRKLNQMPYSEIQKYIQDCGGIHGPRDLLGKPIE